MKILQNKTTLKIDKVIATRCEEKKISLQTLIKQTYHFLLTMHTEFPNDDLNVKLFQIFQEYQDGEYKPLSKSYKNIKADHTEKQGDAYRRIDRGQRKEYFNQLMSIVVNNLNYYNKVCFQPIVKVPIINKYSVDYFMDNLKDSDMNDHVISNSELLLVLMESLLGKIKVSLTKTIEDDSYYGELYSTVYGNNIGTDYTLSHKIIKFIEQELEKIFFCMLIKFDIKMRDKSSNGKARKVHKQYIEKYKNDYKKNIDLFIQNEIQVDEEKSYFEQQDEFLSYITKMHPNTQERTLVLMSIFKKKKVEQESCVAVFNIDEGSCQYF